MAGYGIFPSPPAPDGARYYVFNVGAGQANIVLGQSHSFAHSTGQGRQNPVDRRTARRHQEAGRRRVVFVAATGRSGWNSCGRRCGFSAHRLHERRFRSRRRHAALFIREFFRKISRRKTCSRAISLKTRKPASRLIVIGSGSEAVVLEVTGIDRRKASRGWKAKLHCPQARHARCKRRGNIRFCTAPGRKWTTDASCRVTGDGWGWRPDDSVAADPWTAKRLSPTCAYAAMPVRFTFTPAFWTLHRF